MKFWTYGLMPLLALAVGCDALSSKKDVTQQRNQFDEPNSTGCAQGVVINGQTGERIALVNNQADDGIFVLAHASRLTAGSADGADFLKGEFVVCGIPLDDSFPVFARFHGYNEFYSHVLIDSTIAQKSAKAAVDIRKASPTLIVNIRLYPLGVDTQDLKFQVVHNAAAVEGATVRLTPEGHSYFDDANFLSPLNYRTQPAVQKTDAKGNATFPKESLMLGATYTYDVLPPVTGGTDAAQHGTVMAGLDAKLAKNQADPYSVVVNLADARQGTLAQVSSSLDSADYNAQGQITIVFNRAVKIAPGTADKQTAFLSSASKAKLAANVANNGRSEQLIATAVGNTVVIEPVFAVAPDAAVDAGLEVTYSGIMVQVDGGPGDTAAQDLGNLSVKLFGGTDQPHPVRFAQTLELTSGNNQTGVINAPLAADLKVRIYDQFGDPYAGQSLSFELQAADAGGSLTNHVVATDANGYAGTSWTLGGAVGNQTVLVTATALGNALKNSPMTFSATALDKAVANQLRLDAGGGQTATVATALAIPVKIQVLDQKGNPIAGQTVGFDLSGTNGGGSLSSYSVVSDAGGFAVTSWTLGGTVGSQTLTAHANSGNVALGNVTVTALGTAPVVPTPTPTPTPHA